MISICRVMIFIVAVCNRGFLLAGCTVNHLVNHLHNHTYSPTQSLKHSFYFIHNHSQNLTHKLLIIIILIINLQYTCHFYFLTFSQPFSHFHSFITNIFKKYFSQTNSSRWHHLPLSSKRSGVHRSQRGAPANQPGAPWVAPADHSQSTLFGSPPANQRSLAHDHACSLVPHSCTRTAAAVSAAGAPQYPPGGALNNRHTTYNSHCHN